MLILSLFKKILKLYDNELRMVLITEK